MSGRLYSILLYTENHSLVTDSDISYCRAICKKYGTSYYLGSLFFPRSIRNATHVLYAFFRIPDEIVDEQTADSHASADLREWEKVWESAHNGVCVSHPVLRAAAEVFHNHAIPYDYSVSFLHAMKKDLSIARYENDEALQRYMYGSAAVVGLMMTHVIGYSDVRAFGYAEKLGCAMQRTNFLRDVGEDVVRRGRIYIPQSLLRKFGVLESDIVHGVMSENFTQLMRYEIARLRPMYREANEGISLLSKRGRFAVRVASAMYEAILDEIERSNYDVLRKRARTGFFKKVMCIARAVRAERI